MSRTLSSTALASAHAQETGEVWLVLLTITHSTLPTPIRVVNNTEDITSRGLLFQGFPFRIVLPGESSDGPVHASLEFDNVERTAIAAIRTTNSPPSVTIEVILASAPDTVELSFAGLQLREANYDALTISGELHFESLMNEPITLSMTPSRLPGLF